MLATHLMFYDSNPTLLTISNNVKTPGLYFAEFIGSFIMIGVIYGCIRGSSKHTSLSVSYIVGGMLITTSSTMYANPAVTLDRMFTYAICGIAPSSTLMFIIMELLGAICAALVFRVIFPEKIKEKCDPFECPPKKIIEVKNP